jgi:curved DNA-binding protein CbpA
MTDINEAYRHLCKRDNTVIPSTDYYECLGLLPNADLRMIQVAYDALMHKYRLDLARLSSIQQAYQTLSDANKRRVYDKQRKSAFSYRASDFKLWKVYLAYNLGVYLLMAVIVGLLLLST